MCSFFVALLVVRGQIKEEITPASEEGLIVQFKKESLTRDRRGCVSTDNRATCHPIIAHWL